MNYDLGNFLPPTRIRLYGQRQVFMVVYEFNDIGRLIAIIEKKSKWVIYMSMQWQVHGIKWYVNGGVWMVYLLACFDIPKWSNI